MLSIVITTYNRFENLIRLVISIEESFVFSDKLLSKVIIVDDGSTDSTKNYKSTNQKIYVIHIKNGGPAKARNEGFKYVKTDYVLFIDDDCVITKDYANSIFNHIKNNRYDIISCPAFSLEPKSLIAKYLHELKFLQKPHYDKEGNLECLPSSNLLVKTWVYDKIGGFNQNFNNPGGEDNQFTRTALKFGFALHFDENTHIYHDNNISLKAFVKKYYYYGMGNSLNIQMSENIDKASIFWAKSFLFLLLRFRLFILYSQNEQYKEFSTSNKYHNYIFRLLSFIRHFAFEVGGLRGFKR